MNDLTTKIIAWLIFSAAVIAGGFDSRADEAEEKPAFTGDVYRIPDEDIAESLEVLERIGGKVLFSRDDLYLIIYPADAEYPEAIESGRRLITKPGKRIKGVKPLSIPQIRPVPAMENAGFAFNANYIREGVGLPSPFDGTGVITGMSDTGFDATHSNFLNADGTASRVKKFVHYNVETGERFAAETTADIPAYSTDDPHETHATHVAGIMAGRGGGGRYIGMAPGADIVATTSDLYDVGILAGVEEIIQYAKSVGKPAVINISISSYVGPHDGSSLFCQYLDKCAQDAVICISTGNEGNLGAIASKDGTHIGYTFKTDEDKVTFGLIDTGWAYRNITALDDIYSTDDSPVKVGAYIRDTKLSGRPIVFETPMIDLEETPEWVLTSDPELAESDPRYHYDETFASMFTGEVFFVGGVDPENGRFRAQMYYRADTDIPVSETQTWGRYMFGGYISGKKGQHIDVFADAVHSRFRGATWTLNPLPDTNMSVSNLATGFNVIPVGAYWAAEELKLNNGGTWAGGDPLTVCDFSSYGTLNDNRVTPLTVAPGGPIGSSYSSFTAELYGTGGCCYEHEGYHWSANTGTSMAAPYTAGVIATWLQAYPSLTSSEIREIIKETNNSEDYPLAENPRHGLGFLDPYKGMKLVLEKQLTVVDEILPQTVFARWSDGSLKIQNLMNNDLTVAVFGIDGKELSRIHAGTNDSMSLSGSELNLNGMKGVCICRISSPGSKDEIIKIVL